MENTLFRQQIHVLPTWKSRHLAPHFPEDMCSFLLAGTFRFVFFKFRLSALIISMAESRDIYTVHSQGAFQMLLKLNVSDSLRRRHLH